MFLWKSQLITVHQKKGCRSFSVVYFTSEYKAGAIVSYTDDCFGSLKLVVIIILVLLSVEVTSASTFLEKFAIIPSRRKYMHKQHNIQIAIAIGTTMESAIINL